MKRLTTLLEICLLLDLAACGGGGGGDNNNGDTTANPVTYNLIVTKAGTGSGTVTSNPAGINCGTDCTESYASGTVVTLMATAAADSTFAGWSGDADCTDGNVTLTVAKTCIATFTLTTPQNSLLDEAAQLAQQDFVPSIPENIIELDPPLSGLLQEVGLVFEEYNSITGDKYFDNHVFAFEARPRGNVFRQPLQIFNGNTSPAQNVPYVLANYSYSAPIIQPPLTTIPAVGQYIAGLNVIHLVPGSGSSFPIILTINGDGFLRFTGEPPRTFGSSYRVATHNVGASTSVGDPFNEDFPRIVKVITEVIDASRTRLDFLVDSEAFTGALLCELVPEVESTMDVQGTFIMRRDLSQGMEMNTGFAGMSSLFFQGETETPGISNDEAHDADVLVVTFSDGTNTEFTLINPATVFSMDFNPPSGRTITSLSLEQRDRDPAHYSAFASADYASRSSLAIEQIQASVSLKVTLQIFPAGSEFFDNVVAHVTLLNDLKKGDVVTMSYRLRAF